MTKRSPFATANVFMLLAMAGGTAQAAELRVLSAVGMRQVMLDIGPTFASASSGRSRASFKKFSSSREAS